MLLNVKQGIELECAALVVRRLKLPSELFDRQSCGMYNSLARISS